MGIKGLLGFLRSITKDSSIQEYKGKSLGIDVSCFLYKGAYSCAADLALGIPTKEYINYTIKAVNLMLANNIKPVVVFDGNKLPAKDDVNSSRQRKRKEALEKGRALWNSNDKATATVEFQKALEVTSSMVQVTIEALKDMGVDYIVAPFEADAQLTYLESQSFIQAVVTEDSDLLAFGCKEVIYKLELSGKCKVIKQVDINKCMGIKKFKFEYFRYMCIIAGCDYLVNIDGIGIKRAHVFIQRYAKTSLNIEQALTQIANLVGVRTITIPNGYMSAFSLANSTFLHQSVFDPKNKIEVTLTPIPQSAKIHSMDKFYLNAKNIVDLCIGNINIETGEQINYRSVDEIQRSGSIWGEKPEPKSNEENEDEHDSSYESFIADILVPSKHRIITRSTNKLAVKVIEKLEEISWTIPCFPVMDILFTKVVFELDNKLYNGLINSSDAFQIADRTSANIVCWSSCSIEIDDQTYVVLWKWDVQEELMSDWEESDEASEISYVSETDISSDGNDFSKDGGDSQVRSEVEEPAEVTHTLPFKVLGVTYCKEQQEHLEKAFIKHKEDNSIVTAHIEPEPGNKKDSDAICVMIDYGEGKRRVGYIAKELTQFIHPLLRSNKIINVRVGKIKFQTQWLRIGFYMSIFITRTGEWEQCVVNASRQVKLY